MNSILTYCLTGLVLLLITCEKDLRPVEEKEKGYLTENVIIVVQDGARYSETWGDPSHQYIPMMSDSFAPLGNIYTNFSNDGPTYTSAGHTAMTTGHYQDMNNGGGEYPAYESLFQRWLAQDNKLSNDCWIVTSKDKLEVLKECMQTDWSGKYNPMTDCGVGGNGVGSGYRKDTLTLIKIKQIMALDHPHFVFVSFRDPDNGAHSGQWNNYVTAIKKVDQLTYDLWQFIEQDPVYRGKTTFIVTNDHGRHLDNVSGGFANHGDTCEGCRHINMFAMGPDFYKGLIHSKKRGLIDIAATVAELLQIDLPRGEGEVMWELFRPID
ncbi:MAG: sulfatase-like hydrolase/transferase [Bacteroidetes bacterium]|nr:sulfatase-like hydrolase/transferase [Bacteroidota bacterium]